MYSGVSGMKNFQTKLDVIGNNVSNVNTHGFKKGRVIFKDIFSQTTAGASASTGVRGGTNPQQVGLGSQISTIDTMHGGGSIQTTGNTLDLAIEGDGFFVVADGVGEAGEEPDGYTNPSYTRAGNFYMDSEGYLVNGDGKYVFGASADAEDLEDYPSINDEENSNTTPPNLMIESGTDEAEEGLGITVEDGELTLNSGGDMGDGSLSPIKIPTNAQSMSIGNDGTVTFVDSEGTLRYAGQLIMAKFPNPGGLQKTGGNYYQETANSGGAYYAVGTNQGMGTIQSGALEMSNVDLSEEFTEMIVAQRGFQANTRTITTSDEILQELMNLKR